MAEFDIFVPLCGHDGKKYSRQMINKFRQLIVARFGGMTDFNHESKGIWTIGSVTFRDSILLWRVVSAKTKRNHQFFRQLKTQMQQQLDQQEILIIRRNIRVMS